MILKTFGSVLLILSIVSTAQGKAKHSGDSSSIRTKNEAHSSPVSPQDVGVPSSSSFSIQSTSSGQIKKDPPAESAKASDVRNTSPDNKSGDQSGAGINIQLLAALISAAVALTIGVMTFFHNRRLLKESRIAERRKALSTALNEFYGPLYSYLTVIKALYKLFRAGKPHKFRTLTYLLDPDQWYDTPSGKVKITLSDSDKKLLEEVIDISRKAEELVVAKGGLIDDPVLMFSYVPDPSRTDIDPEKVKGLGLLSLAVTHFRVLRLAYQKSIHDEAERYKDFVYPRELDDKLYARMEILRDELKSIGG